MQIREGQIVDFAQIVVPEGGACMAVERRRSPPIGPWTDGPGVRVADVV